MPKEPIHPAIKVNPMRAPLAMHLPRDIAKRTGSNRSTTTSGTKERRKVGRNYEKRNKTIFYKNLNNITASFIEHVHLDSAT